MRTLFVLLTASALAFAAPEGQAQLLNETVGLTQYPGATDTRIETDDLDSEVYFRADAELQALFDFYDGELAALGWARTELEREDDEVEAVYTREGRELDFELEQDDGGFRLELDVDRDG